MLAGLAQCLRLLRSASEGTHQSRREHSNNHWKGLPFASNYHKLHEDKTELKTRSSSSSRNRKKRRESKMCKFLASLSIYLFILATKTSGKFKAQEDLVRYDRQTPNRPESNLKT